MTDQAGTDDLGTFIRPAARTFFGAPAPDDLADLDAKVGFLGVPSDQGVTMPFFRVGASGGPRLVRDTRTRLRESHPDGSSKGWFDIETERHYLEGLRMADCGDVVLGPGDVQLSLRRISHASRLIAEKGALVVAVGGDHSISFPVGRGVADVYGKLDVVHIDAHADFADEIEGSKFSHGSNLRRLLELPTTDHLSAIGLRAVERVAYEDMKRLGVGFASTRAVLEEGPAAVVNRVVPATENLYVSIDIDVLDGALVPGTTIPEPGGIDFRTLRRLLEAVAGKGRIVGFDIVETSVAQVDYHTAMTSAWLIVHFLTAVFGGAARAPSVNESAAHEVGSESP